jgi:polygalacturonase
VTAPPFGADASGATVTTTPVQAALDAASRYGSPAGHARGVVYVPRGVYVVGNLTLRSNTSVYLEAGAVLRVAPDKSLYTVDAFKESQHRDLTWWIRTEFGSSNIRLYGRGTLDGNGMAATRAGFGTYIVVPIATSHFSLDGLTIRESGTWAVIPTRSNDLSFTNMKIFNRFDMGENDGIDVIESQDVTVRRGIGIALDDPYSTKTWPKGIGITKNWPGEPEELQHVTFDGLVSWTYCYGYKVGQGVAEDQDGVVFENSVVFDAAVGLGVHHKWGHATVSDVTFQNIDIENLSFANDGHRTWLALMVYDGWHDGAGPVRNVTVRDVNVRDKGQTPAPVEGVSETAGIDGVTWDRIRMPGSSGYATSLADLGVQQKFATNLTILPTVS